MATFGHCFFREGFLINSRKGFGGNREVAILSRRRRPGRAASASCSRTMQGKAALILQHRGLRSWHGSDRPCPSARRSHAMCSRCHAHLTTCGGWQESRTHAGEDASKGFAHWACASCSWIFLALGCGRNERHSGIAATDVNGILHGLFHVWRATLFRKMAGVMQGYRLACCRVFE